MIWIQVRDVHVEHGRLATAVVPIVTGQQQSPRGVIEVQIEDPDGIRVVLAGVLAEGAVAADWGGGWVERAAMLTA